MICCSPVGIGGDRATGQAAQQVAEEATAWYRRDIQDHLVELDPQAQQIQIKRPQRQVEDVTHALP